MKNEKRQFDNVDKFSLDLLGREEDVRMVHREVARSQKAIEFAALLVTVDCNKLGQPQGQVAIRMQLAFINVDVVRAVHWFKDVHLTTWSIIFCAESPFSKGGCRAAIIRIRPAITLVRVGFNHRWEHALAIFVPVPARLVQVDLANMGRYDRQVAALELFLAQKAFEGVTQYRPFGLPERQPGSDLGGKREKAEIASPSTMVIGFLRL